MKKNNKKNNRLNFYNFLQKKTIRLLLKLRYLLLAFRKPVKIGFLRLYNEENTIIPCLMSVIDMTDIIVLIYSDIEDSSSGTRPPIHKGQPAGKKVHYPPLPA